MSDCSIAIGYSNRKRERETSKPYEMGMEIPMDLISQLHISLRREAKLPSYDPGGDSSSSAFPTLPFIADAIAELDASPSYLRCRNCKGKLLRGIESLICVFCGKQQRTTDNPPDPIKFSSTSGYRWLLGSLNLNGSEMVEPPKEMNGSGRGRNAPIEGTPVSKLLDLEIRWCAAYEKFANSGLADRTIQSRVPLDLGGLDLDDFFVEGRGDASKVQLAASNPMDDDFQDPRDLNLLVENQGSNALKQHEDVSLFKRKDAVESSSYGEHENLSLFARQDVSSKEDKNLSLFEGVPSSNMVVESLDGKPVDSSSDWDIGFQSSAKQNLSQEQKPVDPLVGSSVDLAAHMDSVFGSGKELFHGKPEYSSTADCFRDDLFSNVIHKAQENDTVVHDGNDGQMIDKNGTSSINIDWIQDDLWQTSRNNASNKTLTDEDDDDWNGFASSANSMITKDEKQRIDMSLILDKTKYQEDDLFDNWNDFTSSTASQLHLQHATEHGEPSIKQTSQKNLLGADFGGFSQSNLFFFGGFSGQNNPADVEILSPATSNLTSNRMAEPPSKDQKSPDSTSNDILGADSKSKSDAAEELMLQMHDLSFMLQSKLSVPSDSKI